MKVHLNRAITVILFGLVLATASRAEVQTRTVNDGQLIMEDIPSIPLDLARDLERYQNVRGASFTGWTPDSSSIYVITRFGDVDQLHRVDNPAGARTQLTFFEEPIGAVIRQPGNSTLALTMDAGGNEFSQIFLFDPSGKDQTAMVSDGESQNGAPIWSRDGSMFAFRSTRRNGKSNDIWLMTAQDADSARMVLESPDGTYWMPSDFSADGKQLLVLNYVGNSDSRIYLLDLETSEMRLLAGDPDNPGVNLPVGFDANDAGFWYATDAAGQFRQLAWQSLKRGATPEFITSDIPWHVEDVVFSENRSRAAFTVNENGFSRLYLMDPETREHRPVSGLPMGVAAAGAFSPDGERLAMTLNTPQTPSDTFVLDLQADPTRHGEWERWTYSEVGGLDTAEFIEPELISYPTFDSGKGGPDAIPAWLYKPDGEGPHPVVISIHGGPEAQARPYFATTYQMWLQSLGAAVLVPNVRGSYGYGKHYLNLDNGFLREDAVKDIGALLDWIATQPELDQDRVAVFGGSYGGYMVIASAVYYSDRFQAAVDIVGISNFVTFLENTQDYRRDSRRAEYGDEREPEMRAFLERISPLNNVEKIAIPMLVVQGENDPRVP
ncbi:MAG: alpha/beta fold hydrolase, partial [Pseudomonadota bacterium]